MKTKSLITSLLVSALMLSAAENVYANGLDVNIVEAGKKELGMIVKNVSGSQLQVQLIDKNEYELLNTVFDSELMTAKKLNLQYLPSGKYSLKFTDDDEIVIIPLELNGINLMALTNEKQHYEKIDMVFEGMQVKLNLNKTPVNPVKVMIYNSEGDLVHKQIYEKGLKSNQTFDFRLLGADTYEFVVYYTKTKYSESITIK